MALPKIYIRRLYLVIDINISKITQKNSISYTYFNYNRKHILKSYIKL